MKKAVYFIKKNVVLCVAAVAAFITCFFVPPSAEYLSYFDYRTLACLFITLAVVCALRQIRFFAILARRIVQMTGSLRVMALALIYITFIGSMIIANDMALITFLPLGYYTLSVTNNDKYAAPLFILQNISANLGGMLTPFGNPQNLYLYSYFSIPTGEFTAIMLPPFVLAVAMLTLCCMFFPKKSLSVNAELGVKLDIKKTVLYLALFAVSILIVFRLVPWQFGLVAIPVVLFFAERDSLYMVDYPLLGTFVMFFIFSGNLSRIPAVNEFVGALLQKSTLLVTTACCQFISNVPSAILLSHFTDNYRELLLGVNIGGAGTPIASLASLITLSEFRLLYPEKTGHYIKLFLGLNALFLVVLTVAAYFFFI
ncbi:MAG: citrate transporter [Oscillospiraceae bacterium]|nr:citrate transporter [Oscillospiraceae bacterium]